jgi:hypothetical protein
MFAARLPLSRGGPWKSCRVTELLMELQSNENVFSCSDEQPEAARER